MNTILVCPADWSLENTFDIYGNCYLFIIFIYLFIYYTRKQHLTRHNYKDRKNTRN